MRKNKGMYVAVAIIAAVVAVLLLVIAGANLFGDPHAGHDHSTNSGHSDDDGHGHGATQKKAAKDCFIYTEEKSGKFSYEVVDRKGNTIAEDYYLTYPVQSKVITEDILAVYGQNGPYLTDGWAIFCNVEGGFVGDKHHNVVAVGKTQVAHVEPRTNGYVLFAYDYYSAANPVEGGDSAVLEGVTYKEGEIAPIRSVEQEDGKVTVFYLTDAGKEKSVTIALK